MLVRLMVRRQRFEVWIEHVQVQECIPHFCPFPDQARWAWGKPAAR